MNGYIVPPPLPIEVSQDKEFDMPPLETDADPPDVDVDDIVEERKTVRIDRVEDMILNHVMVNREVKVLYGDWHIGVVTWYNKKLMSTVCYLTISPKII